MTRIRRPRPARPLLLLSVAAALVATACGGPGAGGSDERDGVTDIRWATSSTGSTGHRAKVNLMAILNREMPNYRITVMPTPGAIFSVKGYATGEYDGYYGADIAFYEMANNIERFEGFQDQMEREPVQSFWTYTVEVGLAVHDRDQDRFSEWRDLRGERVFTGPLPWDTRAQLERAMEALDVGHEYVELDLGTVGPALERGDISAFLTYTASEAEVPPWISEAELATDLTILNPSDEEVDLLSEAELTPVEVDPGAFESDVGVDTISYLPFVYGFHVGLEVPEDDVYRMLTIIEEHAEELAEADSSFQQIAEDMPEMQRRGVESSIDYVEVHPGLARYMRERDVWDPAWDDRVAE